MWLFILRTLVVAAPFHVVSKRLNIRTTSQHIRLLVGTEDMFFGVCVFVSANALEGPNMSLLSKTIPKSWAKGTFNSGFLATEAGTAARSVGDVMISAAATFVGVSNLLNATFLPLLVFALISVVLTRHYFENMIEEDEEDDEATHESGSYISIESK